jgi:hypothetical protein
MALPPANGPDWLSPIVRPGQTPVNKMPVADVPIFLGIAMIVPEGAKTLAGD